MGSDVADELVGESFHKVTEITVVWGRAGTQFVRRQVATSYETLHIGDDAEARNSKWTEVGEPKGWKRKRTVKEWIGFKP